MGTGVFDLEEGETSGVIDFFKIWTPLAKANGSVEATIDLISPNPLGAVSNQGAFTVKALLFWSDAGVHGIRSTYSLQLQRYVRRTADAGSFGYPSDGVAYGHMLHNQRHHHEQCRIQPKPRYPIQSFFLEPALSVWLGLEENSITNKNWKIHCELKRRKGRIPPLFYWGDQDDH